MKSGTRHIQVLEHEHHELERQAADWRDWWHQLSELGQPHFGEMSSRLLRFREQLSTHFQHESSHGPLASHRGESVTEILREQAALLQELDELIGRLQERGPDACCWGDAGREFEEFLDRLHVHQQRESQLIARLVQER